MNTNGTAVIAMGASETSGTWTKCWCGSVVSCINRQLGSLGNVARGDSARHGVWVAADGKEFTVRLARYCARNPIALGRMEYDEQESSVTYHSDKSSGPTAGSESTDALEFLAKLTSHIPNKVPVLQRYYGFYSSRVR